MNEAEQKVTPLELFFDLVFVFAFTQVTGFMSEEPTWGGLGRGMLILAALWWCWGAYAWLTDAIEHDEGAARLTRFASMGGRPCPRSRCSAASRSTSSATSPSACATSAP